MNLESLYDAKVLRKSGIYTKIIENPNFTGNDYILVDSAYPNLHWFVTLFNTILTEQQRLFNKRFSSK